MEAASGGAGAAERDPMAETAGVRRTRSRPVAASVLPEEVVVWEILVRLPAKALLRCRAVCRSWRSLTSDSKFLQARHEHHPSLPLIAFYGQVRNEHNFYDAAFDVFDLRRAPAERRPVLGFNDHNYRLHFVIHASCDGLLLLSLSNGRFNICNPATRQWAPLPALTGAFANIAGLYPHHSSGEYRVLYWKGRYRDALYYVLTVGSSEEPRCIGLPVASDCMKQVMLAGINVADMGFMCPPVLLRNCLHWDPGRCFHNRIVVFDTVVESFRSMSSPTAASSTRLLEMEGTLSITSVDDSEGMMKMWVLQDYEREVWSLRYQIELPMMEVSRFGAQARYYLVLSQEGDMLAWCYNGGYLLHCDSKGKMLEEFRWESWDPSPTGYWFKESLVRHAFFPRQGRGRVRQPRYFRRL